MFSFPCGYGEEAASRISRLLLARPSSGRPDAPVDAPPARVPLRRLVENPASAFSAPEQSERLVELRTEPEWRRFWAELNAGRRTQRPAPPIDFSREMLLAARMQTQPSGGYTVRIDEVIEEATEMVAFARFQSPGPTCGGAAALTTPTDIVAIPATAKKVRWVVARAEQPCP